MNTKKLRVAIVGLGFGAEFVPIYLQHPDVESVAICDADAERVKKTGERFGIEQRFVNIDDIINSDQFDAVHLISGIPDHAKQTLAVLKSGKHCACTVPMATTIEDLQAIIDAQRESGCNYMMMETAVYTRQFFYAQNLRDAGDFGRIQFLRGAHYQDMEGWPPYWAGLPPMWYATHAVSPLLAIANTRATKVHCFGSGVMREELRQQYGNPYPIETAIFETATPGLSAEVTRSLFHTAVSYAEVFTIFGENATYDWKNERENPILTKLSPVVAGAATEIVKGGIGRERLAGAGQVRTKSIDCPEPPDRADLLPEPVGRFTKKFVYGEDENHLSFEEGGGHHGSHPHMVHEFVRSIIENRKPWIDAVTAANWTAAGICAHKSAMAGGAEVIIPEFA